MVLEKKYQVAISKNAKGEIVDCLDCEIVNGEKYKAYKKESALLKAKKEEKLKEELQKVQEEKTQLERKLAKQTILIAKCFFDNEVANGVCETNDPFEKAFSNYIYNGIAFELEIAPSEFKAILERLG